MNIYWVGTPKGKSITNKFYYEDITEQYNRSLELIQDEKEVEKFIKENVFKDYNSFIVRAKSPKEAIDIVVEKFTTDSKLQLLK